MPRITLDLLRRRAEHNEGVLSTLEEITLHQQDLEKIEVVGDACRGLQILYLQNNLIRKIEGLVHLKSLWYLNLAINSIQHIEGLEGCESLKKLDLTCNFITDITSVRRLRKNIHLETLYLTGNPCTETEGYRQYVIQNLPHLYDLDGEGVKRSEVIVAQQEALPVDLQKRDEAAKAAEEQRDYDEKKAAGELPAPQYNEKGERLYANTPDDRDACYQEMQDKINQAKNPPKDPNSISAQWEANEKMHARKKLTAEEEIEKYGRILQKNEGKFPYKMWEDKQNVYLEILPGKFISTASIDVDIQPEYARIEVKGKVFQMLLSSEVAPMRSSVKRGTAKGELLLTMPIVGDFKGVADISMSIHKKKNAGETDAAAAAAAAKQKEEAEKKKMDPLTRESLLDFGEKKRSASPPGAPAMVETRHGGLRPANQDARIEELD